LIDTGLQMPHVTRMSCMHLVKHQMTGYRTRCDDDFDFCRRETH
jgi:hypothetical protein